MPDHSNVAKGLAGVSITDTRIGKSDADGSLIYRGYPIKELVDKASFEEVAYLITNGRLPRQSELEEFRTSLAAQLEVPGTVFGLMGELGRDSHPIDVLRTAVSSLGSLERLPPGQAQQTSIEAKMSVLAANCYRVPRGEAPVEPREGLGFAANLLWMLTKKEPTPFDTWVFERALILYMEHDLNASSFTVRVVASTLADPYAAVTAGLAALKGPLHGGANEEAMSMLLKVGNEKNASRYVEQELKEGRKITGFGHRVYKSFDPRAMILKEALREIVERRKEDDWLYKLCDAVEREMKERKNLPANLDFYAAPVFYLLGIEVPLYTPIFAASRVFGWMAHYDEQVADNKLIRPDATFVGPTDLKYVPMDER